MKTVNAGAIIELDGIMYQVAGWTTDKTLILEPLEDNATMKCPCCGIEIKYKERRTEVESCRNFQESAKPVETLKES